MQPASLQVSVSANNSSDVKFVLHNLPCDIDFSGPIDSETYFLTHPVSTGESGTFRAQFHGRDLEGIQVQVPHPLFIFHESVACPDGDANDGRIWSLEGTAEGFVDWDWNRPPAQHSTVGECVAAWPAVAAALHAPVPAAEVRAEVQRLGAEGAASP
eukprot:EG_transcript_39784